MKSLKKIFLLIIAVAMIFQLTACSDKNKAKMSDTLYEVTMEEYNTTLEMVKLNFQQQYLDQWELLKDNENVIKRMEEIAIEQLILDKVLLNEANLAKITVTEKEINDEYDRIKEEYSKTGNFEEYLTQNNMTIESYKENIKNMFLINGFLKSKASEIASKTPSDKQLKEFFNSNKSIFEQVKASHILVDTEEEAKDIKKKLDAGGNFEELAKEFSKDSSASEGGSLGTFTADQMVPEFSNAAFSMSVGQISDPVKTDYGYHIIKVVDRKDTFEQMNKDEVIYEYRMSEYTKLLSDYLDNANVKMPDELVKIRERIRDAQNQ